MPKRVFEEVVLPHLDAAFNYARWLTKNDADAEDVVQDAAVRALRFFAGRPVAALVYQHRQHTINVFEWPASDSREALRDARALRGFQVRHWTRDGMTFWAVSDLNDAELDQFVGALHP